MTTPAERTRALKYTWDIINQVAMDELVSQEILRYVIRHFPSPTAVSLMAQDAPQWLSDSFASPAVPDVMLCSVCQKTVRKERVTETISNKRKVRCCPTCEAARQDGLKREPLP